MGAVTSQVEIPIRNIIASRDLRPGDRVLVML
jgi:hypothetical protein